MKSTASYNGDTLIPLERYPTSYDVWNREFSIFSDALRHYYQPGSEPALYVGCGRRLPDWDCKCLDADPEVGRDNPNFVPGDAMELPFADGEFALTFSSHTLEHLPDARLALIEQARVTRSGGYVGAILPDREWTGGSDPTHVREFTMEEFISEFGDVQGLELIRFGTAEQHYSFWALWKVK